MDAPVTRSEPELQLGPERSIHHPLDPISLAFGAIFTILGAVFLFGNIDAASLSMAWVWAGLFGAIGLLLLAVGIRRHRAYAPAREAEGPEGPSDRSLESEETL